MSEILLDRIQSPAPKKILACDGGGILGLISVEILAKLEADLRKESGEKDLVLADWFDFVCGTSTGAIIAACIAAGMSMDKIRAFYLESGEQMFDKASILKRLHYEYESEPLAKKLRTELNKALGYKPDAAPATLGDPGPRHSFSVAMSTHKGNRQQWCGASLIRQ